MVFGQQHLPERTAKPRIEGITMVLDKGLSTTQAANVAELGAQAVDVVKFGWGTAIVSPNIREKIAIYREGNIDVYLGGTLFEWFLVRDDLEAYLRLVDSLGLGKIEISNGTIWISEDQKTGLIRQLSKNFEVYSEVGSKDPSVDIPVADWVRMIEAELSAGASKVICESRESGNVGLFDKSGKVKNSLIEEIVGHFDTSRIMFEAPNKDQQVWFIKKFGANVNLGNINPWDIIPLETIRCGLRSDTLFHFLQPEFSSRYEEVKSDV